jgi:hypothetical protein
MPPLLARDFQPRSGLASERTAEFGIVVWVEDVKLRVDVLGCAGKADVSGVREIGALEGHGYA